MWTCFPCDRNTTDGSFCWLVHLTWLSISPTVFYCFPILRLFFTIVTYYSIKTEANLFDFASRSKLSVLAIMFFLQVASEGSPDTFKCDFHFGTRVSHLAAMSSSINSAGVSILTWAIMDEAAVDTATALISWRATLSFAWPTVILASVHQPVSIFKAPNTVSGFNIKTFTRLVLNREISFLSKRLFFVASYWRPSSTRASVRRPKAD